MRIAFATSESWPALSESDRILAGEFAGRGHDVVPLVWSSDASLRGVDAVLVRSCWDYHLAPEKFLAWIDIVARTCLLWNDSSLIRWNAYKNYLLDLQATGVPTIPTMVCHEGAIDRRHFEQLKSERLVVKPIVGASGYGLIVISREETPFRLSSPSLAQPFLQSIREGERSAVMIDGRLTHLVLKRPPAGGVLVQRDHGGSAEVIPTMPPDAAFCARVLSALSRTPLYARVDFVMTDSGPLLMELELIEPELFFELVPSAAATFAEAVERRMVPHFSAHSR